jgi:MoaA/NifB/PqqE/SkfB family radical SAM enzyme
MEVATVKKSSSIATIDFHVTSRCSQECPYCWGPLNVKEVKRREALSIIEKVHRHGIRRIVFTGGDPLQRRDLGKLVKHAKLLGLEVAVSTTGDRLTKRFLRRYGRFIDLVSIPIDGSNEEINSLTKERGHFSAVMKSLRLLEKYPEIDVKICTALTRLNAHDLRRMLHLVWSWARTAPNRVFYNIFNTYPRAMKEVDWDVYLLTDDEFEALKEHAEEVPGLSVNFLNRRTLDALYVLIFPDGDLYLPIGPEYVKLGRFLDIDDLDQAVASAGFDAEKHLLHSKGWSKIHPGTGLRRLSRS